MNSNEASRLGVFAQFIIIILILLIIIITFIFIISNLVDMNVKLCKKDLKFKISGS